MARNLNSLRSFTTMKIGGDCENLVFLKDLDAGISKWPQPIRVLGNGSNILVDDHFLRGTVIVTRDQAPVDPEILENFSDGGMRLRVSAGLYLPTLSAWATKRSLTGCEYLVGVPGTVGGAVVQNAGANQQEFSDILESADAVHLKTSEKRSFSCSELQMKYRESFFKHDSEWLVTSAILSLASGLPEEISARVQKNLQYRKQFTPYTKASLGSVYTRGNHEGKAYFPGQVIEEAGLKGFQMGGARVSDIHANYIVNENQAIFDDVIGVMNEIEKRVFEKFCIKLQREILIWSDRV